MRKQILRSLLFLLLGLALAGLFTLVPKKALAANPTTINFQGKVVNSNGTNVTDGNYTFVFRLYDSSTAANISTNCSDNSHCWWEETDSLTVTGGVFQVQLGSICAFSSACNSTHSGINWNTNNSLYLTMNFNGDTSGSFHGFMNPLIELSSVPYAYNADNLGGIAASGFIQNQNSGPQSSSNFDISGTGIASTFQAGTLQSGSGNLTLDAAGGTIQLAADVTTIQKASGALALDISSVQLENSSAVVVADLNTANSTANNLITDPSFEAGSLNANWTALNAGAPAQDTTHVYEGSKAMKIVTGTNASGGGAKYTSGSTFLTSGTTYSLSALIKTDYAGAFSTFEMGHADNGTLPTLVPCLTGKTLDSGWTRFSCTWISGTITGSPFIYFKQTDAVTKNIWVDDVILQTDANATNTYRNATLDLTGTEIQSPLILHDISNETNAFQVQNSTGVQVFNIDTTDTNLAGANPGFEVNAADWALKGSATNLQRDTSKSYQGIASGKFTTTATSGDGARFTFPAQLPANTYTISLEVLVSAADSTFNIGYNNGSDTNCASISPAASATAPSTTGWMRFTCTTATSAVLNSVYITSGTTAESSGMWVDGLEVDAGATASNYAAGQVSFNAALSSPVIFQAGSNSTTAFQIQNSSGTNLLAVDTLNNLVIIGGSTKLQFLNATNSNTISIASGATAGSITVNLPATTPGATTQQGAANLPFAINLVADSAASSSTTLADITASGNTSDALSLVIPLGATVKFNAQIIYVSSSTSNAATFGWKCSNTSQLSTAAGVLATSNAVITSGTVTACGTTAAAIVTGSTTGSTLPQLVTISGTVKANATGNTTLTFEYARSGTTGSTTIKAGSNITWWQ